MWSIKNVEMNGINYKCEVKHYEEPSQFGINCGKISKLFIKDGFKVICGYDREWFRKPTDETVKAIFNQLVEEFN